MDNKLLKAYYSTDGYWKGYFAISKLASKVKVSKGEARKWLFRQAIWQIYLHKPKYIPRPHWTITTPNEIIESEV